MQLDKSFFNDSAKTKRHSVMIDILLCVLSCSIQPKVVRKDDADLVSFVLPRDACIILSDTRDCPSLLSTI